MGKRRTRARRTETTQAVNSAKKVTAEKPPKHPAAEALGQPFGSVGSTPVRLLLAVRTANVTVVKTATRLRSAT